MILNNSAANSTTIGAGGLFIGGPLAVTTGGTNNQVSLNFNEQINDNAPVFIDGVTGSMSTQLNLNTHTETVGPLTIAGGTQTAFVTGVSTGVGGKLILNGDLNFINDRQGGGNTGREILITTSGTATVANFAGTGQLDLGGVIAISSSILPTPG